MISFRQTKCKFSKLFLEKKAFDEEIVCFVSNPPWKERSEKKLNYIPLLNEISDLELDLASMVLNHHHLFSLEHYLTRLFHYLKETVSVMLSLTRLFYYLKGTVSVMLSLTRLFHYLKGTVSVMLSLTSLFHYLEGTVSVMLSLTRLFYYLKGAVSVTSCYPPGKDGNVRFTIRCL